MELTSQNKEIGTPSSFCHNTSNVVSSSKIPHQITAPQALDRHRPPYHHDQLDQQHQSHKPPRDPDLSSDPASITATRAMNTASTLTRPILRLPPPVLTTTSMPSTRYRECLKNHAASMGGHVVDGCGEFMPNGEEGTPEALICAACECHRNFHRKEVDGETQYTNSYYTTNGQRNALPSPQPPSTSFHPLQPPPLHQHHRYHHGFSISTSMAPFVPIMMNFGSGGAAESSSEDLNIFQSDIHRQASMQRASSKKRFRTKFSQEQQKKMMEFAEKLGWKIQKQDDQEVQQFCSQVGVKKKVFKVWMHNKKQAMKRRPM